MVKFSTAKWVVIWLSLMLMFAFTLVVYITFMWIYFRPEHSYFITLDLFGERDLEFVLLVVLAPIVLVGFLWNAKLLLRSWEKDHTTAEPATT